ncbi:STAS domain-containing protein [Streptomyces sp. ISL-96]|uniref:STAS domain-containing protein n=1 Tax=Streptomyces sp. ISL-96 TaxID=2819191 RepID=UPI0027E33B7C|nr:STAS domain-containing protein [Streptomyces sp. ISL-96]
MDAGRAELALSGEVTGNAALEIEECLSHKSLRGVCEWVLDLSEVEYLDATCAYALMRPLVEGSPPPVVIVRGARRRVRRTLHETGAEKLLHIED